MKKKRISQETLGSIIHVSRSAIGKYENGLGLPSEEVIASLCSYFEISRDELFPKHDLESIIVTKNKKIWTRTILLMVSLSLIIVGSIIQIGDYISRHATVGGLEIINAAKLSNNPTNTQQFFTVNQHEFGYIETYKNAVNEFILKPGAILWSVNGIPDFLMAYYNGEDITLYVYTNPNTKLEIEYHSIAENGKYCFNTSGYGMGYNFMMVNDSLNDVNIKYLEFWC